jgi:protoheme IX farnesyltransferase
MFKTYIRLTKPGIVVSNLMIAAASFLFGSTAHLYAIDFVAMVAGLGLIIASGCVFNNYIDRGIDAKMKRTKKRALVTGQISARTALMYASLLGVAGSVILGLWVNLLTLAVALFGLFFYVIVYGIGKRRTVHGTLIGSISGSVPPVVGYCGATNHLDGGALLLFIIMVFWQMPHFYAIAIYRSHEYATAGLPVLPVVKGIQVAKTQITSYIAAYVIAAMALSWFGYAGKTYLAVMLIAGVYWLWLAAKGFNTEDDNRWARKIFGTSLLVLVTFSVIISLDALLP